MASPIPVIDLAAATSGELTDALIRSSCAFVVGHGVDPRLHARMIEVSRAFFDLPTEDKAKVRWPGDGQWRGWLPVFEGGQDLNGDGPPELLEKYEIQLSHPWLRNDDAGLAAWGATFDSWPAAPGKLRQRWTAYYYEMGLLACRIVGMIVARSHCQSRRSMTGRSTTLPTWWSTTTSPRRSPLYAANCGLGPTPTSVG